MKCDFQKELQLKAKEKRLETLTKKSEVNAAGM